MALLDKLQNDKSKYSKYNGANGVQNPLVAYPSKDSPLHAGADGTAGYSLGNSKVRRLVYDLYNQYDDGVSNPNVLPTSPSKLDLSFNPPINAPRYNYTQNFLPENDYRKNAPEGQGGRI